MKRSTKLVAVALIISLLTVFLAGCRDAHAELEKNFQDNGKGEPYSQKVPLSEMDFSPYVEELFTVMTIAPIAHDYTSEIVLPCDVEYYTAKTDKTPAVTLEKGTTVYVLPSDEPDLKRAGDMGSLFIRKNSSTG